MKTFVAPIYTREDLEIMGEDELSFPFSDEDAVYDGKTHQYRLTPAYFQERGRNLNVEIDGDEPEKVKHWLMELQNKVYTFIYAHNQSTRRQMNYMIAKRPLRGFTPYEYRQAFLDAMFREGCYLLDNGDLSSVTGVDIDTMQNMSVAVMREQNRDFHKDCISALTSLGLCYMGRYKFCPRGEDW